MSPLTHIATTAILLISLCLLGATLATDNDTQISTNPTQKVQVYTFQRQLSWSNRDFQIQQLGNSTNQFDVNFHLGDRLLGQLKFDIQNSTDKFSVKANSGRVWCGLKQTYKMSNGVQFLVDPRYILRDRWYIKKSGNLAQRYTYYRGTFSNSGYVTSEDGRRVAHLKVETFGSEELSNLYHETFPGATLHRILTNTEIPIEVLAALFITVELRVDECDL